jgi:hypothetical protein
MTNQKHFITRYLEVSSPSVFTLYAILVSFSTYFCMYAFRKPFAAASYENVEIFSLTLKTVFVISQILGYTLSKYAGIKICSEIKRGQRAFALIALICLAECALLLFAVLPMHWKIAAIFLNGFPLGMVWGVVVSYLEGRRTSELLLAGLSCSFIVSSGLVKDFGLKLMVNHGVPEFWMPFVTGLCFLPFFILFVWLLDKIPQPTFQDVEARVVREPMNGEKRKAFVKQFFWGMVFLFIAYFFLTAYRDFRDNYGVEILRDLGYQNEIADMIFTRTEWPVAFGVLVAMAAINAVKDNRRGLIAIYVIMAGGTALMGISTLLMNAGVISGLWWMTLVGLGSYLAYVPYGSVLFDRTIASTKAVGTAVFTIYLADAIGYTGSVGVQLYKDLGHNTLSYLHFFVRYTYFMSMIGTVFLCISCVYFLRKSYAVQPYTPRQE